MIPRILIAACAAIILFFASVHLAYTFFTDQLTPAEGQMETAMKHVVSRISSGTTMWKAWVGFNVSHSMDLMLFGLIYGYLTVCGGALQSGVQLSSHQRHFFDA